MKVNSIHKICKLTKGGLKTTENNKSRRGLIYPLKYLVRLYAKWNRYWGDRVTAFLFAVWSFLIAGYIVLGIVTLCLLRYR